jgi:hypothetical protein
VDVKRKPAWPAAEAVDPSLILWLAGAVAAGTALFLWSRKRRPQSEESTAEEVEAHPS